MGYYVLQESYDKHEREFRFISLFIEAILYSRILQRLSGAEVSCHVSCQHLRRASKSSGCSTSHSNCLGNVLGNNRRTWTPGPCHPCSCSWPQHGPTWVNCLKILAKGYGKMNDIMMYRIRMMPGKTVYVSQVSHCSVSFNREAILDISWKFLNGKGTHIETRQQLFLTKLQRSINRDLFIWTGKQEKILPNVTS